MKNKNKAQDKVKKKGRSSFAKKGSSIFIQKNKSVNESKSLSRKDKKIHATMASLTCILEENHHVGEVMSDLSVEAKPFQVDATKAFQESKAMSICFRWH